MKKIDCRMNPMSPVFRNSWNLQIIPRVIASLHWNLKSQILVAQVGHQLQIKMAKKLRTAEAHLRKNKSKQFERGKCLNFFIYFEAFPTFVEFWDSWILDIITNLFDLMLYIPGGRKGQREWRGMPKQSQSWPGGSRLDTTLTGGGASTGQWWWQKVDSIITELLLFSVFSPVVNIRFRQA